MVRKEFVVDEVQKLMSNVEQIRNVAIVAHVDHGLAAWRRGVRGAGSP